MIVSSARGVRKVEPWLFLLPALGAFATFLFWPFFKTIYLSLFLTNRLGLPKVFVGLGNYISLFQSPAFYNSLFVTLVFVVLMVAGSMAMGLGTALLCNAAFPGRGLFRTMYAMPMAIASSSAAMIFKVVLHPTVGVVNKLTGLSINWLADPSWALICVAVISSWLNSGINFLYFSAGLANIDQTLYERASSDGASRWQQLRYVTLPGLRPILFFTLVVNVIMAFQSFAQVRVLTRGGPGDATNVIVHSIYRDAFFNFRFGSAAAQSVVLFVIIMILTLAMFKSKRSGRP